MNNNELIERLKIKQELCDEFGTHYFRVEADLWCEMLAALSPDNLLDEFAEEINNMTPEDVMKEILAHIRREESAPVQSEEVESVISRLQRKAIAWDGFGKTLPPLEFETKTADLIERLVISAGYWENCTAAALEQKAELQSRIDEQDKVIEGQHYNALQRIEEAKAMQAKINELEASGIHSCGPNCQRVECVLRRQIKELEGELKAAKVFEASYRKHRGVLQARLDELESKIQDEEVQSQKTFWIDVAKKAGAKADKLAEKIEFERNLTFKYEKLSAELQSRIDELEAGISDEIEALQETITNSIKREDILQAQIKEYETFLFSRSHMCSGRDCVGIYQEPTGSLPRCDDCSKVAAMKGEDHE